MQRKTRARIPHASNLDKGLQRGDLLRLIYCMAGPLQEVSR